MRWQRPSVEVSLSCAQVRNSETALFEEAYDQAAEAPDDENEEAFRELDRASQFLMRAEASTLAGLIALLQEAGAPGFPIEIPFAGRWSAAFGTFWANVANSLVAIVTAGSAATPERIDRIANAIVEATAPLNDDFEVADARPELRSRPSHHEPHP
jgi:hypothetical protein